MKQKEFKVGDKVFDLRFGWGIVDGKNNDSYCVSVKFEKDHQNYTEEGYFFTSEMNPTLSHTEYGPHIQSQSKFKIDDKIIVLRNNGDRPVGIIESIISDREEGTFYIIKYSCGNMTRERTIEKLPEETITELTLEQIAEKVGIPAHLLRIKK